jgi:uncharacterized protein YacL
MDVSIKLIRIIFLILSVLLSTTYNLSIQNENSTIINLAYSLLGGIFLSCTIMGLGWIFRKFNLRTFNTAVIGMFFGYLLGQATLTIISGVVDFNALNMNGFNEAFFKSSIYLAAIYLGMIMTARAAKEFHVSLPFFKFKSTMLKKKDILIDSSVLYDARIIDLAASGLLDNLILIPRFIITELQSNLEKGDESSRNKAKKALEIIKKLETLPSLDMRYCDNDFPEIKDCLEKIIRLARFLDANILTSDINQIQQSKVEDVRIIKFQSLCNALKPLSQTGEFLNIKVQRYGKEPRQGIGYLDDGTMVVVNGGAEYIGDSIKAQVLSVKHTSSGRMIFCNALEENTFDNLEYEPASSYQSQLDQLEAEESPSKYFAV